MLVSTEAGRDRSGLETLSPMAAARRWSLSRRSKWCSMACSPAAARCPLGACRRPSPLPRPVGFLDESPASEQNGSHRGSESLRETQGNAVEPAPVAGPILAGGPQGIPRPGPIEMKRQPKVPTGRRSGLEVRLRLDGSAPLVHGILDAHQRGPRSGCLRDSPQNGWSPPAAPPRGAWTRRTLAPLLRAMPPPS